MGKVIKLNKEIPNADDPPLRVEVHVCGLCGSENFWLYKKPINEHSYLCNYFLFPLATVLISKIVLSNYVQGMLVEIIKRHQV